MIIDTCIFHQGPFSFQAKNSTNEKKYIAYNIRNTFSQSGSQPLLVNDTECPTSKSVFKYLIHFEFRITPHNQFINDVYSTGEELKYIWFCIFTIEVVIWFARRF